jgi:hypothetical protein
MSKITVRLCHGERSQVRVREIAGERQVQVRRR